MSKKKKKKERHKKETSNQINGRLKKIGTCFPIKNKFLIRKESLISSVKLLQSLGALKRNQKGLNDPSTIKSQAMKQLKSRALNRNFLPIGLFQTEMQF